MTSEIVLYSIILLLGVFIASISQIMLKKSANAQHGSTKDEYLNPLVITAYVLFFGTTLLSILAYKVVPLSMGPVLEATSYIWITIFGVTIFKEKLTKKKIFALFLIIAGITIFCFGSF